MKFKGKNVLITGGSKGIGKATAMAFACEGAKVGINYNSDKNAAEQTLAGLDGEGHHLFRYNLLDPQTPKKLIDDFIKNFGTIDILVNNAGISAFQSVNDEFDDWESAWEQTLRVNLRTPADLSYWAAQQMKRNGGGRIVNISSRGAFRGEPRNPAYGASKAALNAMSQSMAKALAPEHIYVFVVAPGFTDTDMARKTLTPEAEQQLMQESPFQRMARPEEVAEAVLYFAGEKAAYASGAILDINGASYLRS